MRILAGPVDLDIMVRMLDPRAAQATLTQRRYQPGQQGRLAGPEAATNPNTGTQYNSVTFGIRKALANKHRPVSIR